jgi:uncharacterized protein YdhG (YjbR/CyaY superfamily)
MATAVDAYLAKATKDQRVTLDRLRRTIKAAAPKAVESVSYGIVGYKHKGQRLIYFGYWKTHCALYGMSSGYIEAHAAELKTYGLTKRGMIRFTPEAPLPGRLVTKIVKARVTEIDEAA